MTPGTAGTMPVRQHRLQPPVTEQERAPTPDPFANSPLDDEDDVEIGLGGPLQPQVRPPVPPPPLPSTLPVTSLTGSTPGVQRGYDVDDDGASSQLPGGMSTTKSVGKSSFGMGRSGMEGSIRGEDIDESQLFPGSDLF